MQLAILPLRLARHIATTSHVVNVRVEAHDVHCIHVPQSALSTLKKLLAALFSNLLKSSGD